jgi:hypothetical protein
LSVNSDVFFKSFAQRSRLGQLQRMVPGHTQTFLSSSTDQPSAGEVHSESSPVYGQQLGEVHTLKITFQRWVPSDDDVAKPA